MRNNKAITKNEVLSDISALEGLALTEEDKEKLHRLKITALNSVSLNTWFRRLFFGFSLTDAIERWLSAFDPSLSKPLGEQIPKEETTDVVTAWMRFSIRRGILLLLVSSLITLVTAGFLYWQIQKQDELIGVQTRSENQKNIFLYLQSLYDETCVKQTIDSPDDPKHIGTKMVCISEHNSRQRSEALKGYIQLIGEEADLSSAHLESTNSIWFDFKRAKMQNANLQWANLQEADLGRANLGSANLQEANLQEANLQEANLGNADLQWANLRGAKLQEANLQEANLWSAKLQWANLQEANLWSANLQEADLRSADLREANLQEANLQEANLWSAKLQEADLRSADLRGAKLQEADLQEANLWSANLGSADLRRANLHEANLREADLSFVTGLTCEIIKAATNWQTAYRVKNLACGAPIPEKP